MCAAKAPVGVVVMGGGPKLFAKYCMQAAVCKCVSCIWKQCHSALTHLLSDDLYMTACK